MKRCSKCGETRPAEEFSRDRREKDGLQARCRACNNASRKVYRAEHKEEIYLWFRAYLQTPAGKAWHRKASAKYQKSEKNRPKHRARAAVKWAVKTGKLIKPTTCSKCGKPPIHGKIQGHHDDYSRPLDVVWLCPRCDKARHAELARNKKLNPNNGG